VSCKNEGNCLSGNAITNYARGSLAGRLNGGEKTEGSFDGALSQARSRSTSGGDFASRIRRVPVNELDNSLPP
jgi:hypothetical protein